MILCRFSVLSLQLVNLSPAGEESLEGQGCFPDTPTSPSCRHSEVIAKYVLVLSFVLDSHCRGALNYGSRGSAGGARRSRDQAGSVHST